MLRSLSVLVLVLCAAPSFASNEDIEARLKRDIQFLASDECEGRGVGTKGLDMAADYLAEQFREAGLKPGGVKDTYFQPFPFAKGSELDGTSEVALTGPDTKRISLKQGTDFQVVGASSAAKLTAPLVFVGYGVDAPMVPYQDFKGVDVKGKVVVLIRRLPRWTSKDQPFDGARRDNHAVLDSKVTLAEQNGAAGILLVNDASELPKDALMNFQATSKAVSHSKLPFIHIKREILESLLKDAKQASLKEIEDAIDKDLKPVRADLSAWNVALEVKVKRVNVAVRNVIGVVEGSGPLANETVVIGAHYDHLGYGGPGSRAKEPNKKEIHHGADDNGSGTTVMLELARQFAKKDRQGRRLVFMGFTAEESGLIGSRYYTKREPLFALKDTVAMVNLDMVGRLRTDPKSKKDKLYVEGTGTAKTFDKMLEQLNPGFELVKKPGGNGPSDHDSFYNQKIPVVFFWTSFHEDYHKPSDTWDKINIEGMRKVGEFASAVIERLATEPARPEYVAVASSFSPNMGKVPRLGIAPDYSSDKKGLVVDSVSKDGPAEKGGLKAGDIIVDIAGKAVTDINSYMAALRTQQPGREVEVQVDRDGERLKLKITPQ